MPLYGTPAINGSTQGTYAGASTHGPSLADIGHHALTAGQPWVPGPAAQDVNLGTKLGIGQLAGDAVCKASPGIESWLEDQYRKMPSMVKAVVGGGMMMLPFHYANQVCAALGMSPPPQQGGVTCSSNYQACIESALGGTLTLLDTHIQQCYCPATNLGPTNTAITAVATQITGAVAIINGLGDTLAIMEGEIEDILYDTDFLSQNITGQLTGNPLWLVKLKEWEQSNPTNNDAQLQAVMHHNKPDGTSTVAWLNSLMSDWTCTAMENDNVICNYTGAIVHPMFDYAYWPWDAYKRVLALKGGSGLQPWGKWPFFWVNQEPNATESAELLAFDTSNISASSDLLTELVEQLNAYGWTSRGDRLTPTGVSVYATGLTVAVLISDFTIDSERNYFYTDNIGGSKRSILGDLLSVAESIPFLR